MAARRRVAVDASALEACEAAGFGAQQWPHAIAALRRLKADCLALSHLRPEENFFLRWRSARRLLAKEVRPALLGYVAEVLDFYLDQVELGGMPVDRRRCGAEFWVQRRAPGHDITFHWDKDEALREAASMLIHPAVSTVSYLSDGGAPTVVLEVRASGGGGVSGGSLVPDGAEILVGSRRKPLAPGGKVQHGAALISYPREGKLLAFSGALLHGVPAQLAEEAVGERLTLLVNVWVHHHPLGVPALPDAVERQLSARVAGRILSSDPRHDPSLPLSIPGPRDASEACSYKPHRGTPTSARQLGELQVHVCGDDHVLRVQLEQGRRVACDCIEVGARAAPLKRRKLVEGGGIEGSSLSCFKVPYRSEAISGLPDWNSPEKMGFATA